MKQVKIILTESKEKKFFVDAMLGKLAKKLRMFGYDTLYASTINDENILEIIKTQERILVTKDRNLHQKALKNYYKSVFLDGDSEISQFIQLKNNLELENFTIDPNMARCTLCNGILQHIMKNSIEDKIPGKIFEFNKNFWQCTNCEQIYWEGTHIINLQEFVNRINEV